MLHDRVVAVGGEAVAHGVSVLLIGKGADLNVKQRVRGGVGHQDRVLFLLQG